MTEEQTPTRRFGAPVLDSLDSDLRILADLWQRSEHPYVRRPVEWIREVLEEHVWSKIAEVCESVVTNRYTTVRSCHGVGKSWVASRLVCWWLATHEDAFVVTTAPTAHQVRSVLWREIKRGMKKAGMPGNITNNQVPEWSINGELVAFGRKPADYSDADEAATAFQGIHALNLLVVMDEGAGIPEWLANAVETLITNERSRMLVIGNPTNPISWFAKTFRPGQGYHAIKIGWTDTPAFTGEPIPSDLRERLISHMWVEERRRRWGESSPLFISRVYAEFPDVSDDAVFSPATISIGLAIDRSSLAVGAKENRGWDVARYGVDENVVYSNKNGYVRLIARWGKVDTMESVGRYRRLDQDINVSLLPSCQIDVAGGLGAGPYDRLRELNYPVVPFNGGERPYNPNRFRNRRAEAYWEAKELMESGQVDIEEEDEDLQAELLEVKFKHTSTGLIQIEDKEELKKRIGHSPDRADAFVMSLQKRASWSKILDVPQRPTDELEDTPAEDLVNDLLDIKL